MAKLFIALLLGSYDPQTKQYLEKVKEEIVKYFSGENVYALLLERLEIYETDIGLALTERIADDRMSVFLFQENQILDIDEIKLQGKNFDANLYSYLKQKYEAQMITKHTIFDKLDILMHSANAIFLLRQKEETRGGEYLELMHALFRGHSNKILFFKKEGIELSAMLMEYLDKHKVVMRSYKSEQELVDSIIRIVMYRLHDSVQ